MIRFFFKVLFIKDRQTLLYFNLSGQFQSTFSDTLQLKPLGNSYGSEAESEFGIRSEQKSLKLL